MNAKDYKVRIEVSALRNNTEKYGVWKTDNVPYGVPKLMEVFDSEQEAERYAEELKKCHTKEN